MQRQFLRNSVFVLVVFFGVFGSTSAWAAGNNWLHGQLRSDTAAVYNARRYAMQIKAVEIPTQSLSNDTFTTAWLAVWPEGSISNPQGFTQVGLLTNRNGIHWFAYSHQGATCLRGSQHWGSSGCLGDTNDIVGLNQFHRVELVKNTNENFWRARVYSTSGTSFDVATIPSSSNRIYRADADFEEGYIEPIDPQITGRYYLYRPEYYSGATPVTWQLSADSASEQNYVSLDRAVNGVHIDPNFICPGVYGVTPNVDINDPWHWYAGTGGIQCGHIFPPAAYDDFHANVTYTGSWTASWGCCPRAWKQSLHWSNATGDGTNNTTTLTTVSGFHPTDSLTRVFTMAPNRGTTCVRIGSTNYDNNDYAAENRWQVARTWSLSGATTLKVFKIAGDATRYSDVDAFLVDVPRAAAVPNNDDRYDNYHYLMRYLGSWTHNSTSVPNAHKDTLSWTNNAGDTVSFTFVGNKIKYHYTRHWNRGIAVITIDGVNYGEVNACSGTTQWHRSDTFPPGTAVLGPGVHTINTTNSGRTTCGTGSNYTYIDVDHLTPHN
jgi:hypothetical protein